jgi:hypothetical protein
MYIEITAWFLASFMVCCYRIRFIANVYNLLYPKLPKMEQSSSQWAEVIAQLFDRLTGKGASVTYNFDNLVIDMPKAQGPGGRDMGAAKWTINGKIMITGEAHQTSEEARQRASVSTVT